MSRDVVYIRGLEVETVIGVYAWERTLRQTLVFDLDLACDARRAAASDRIGDALDYDAVATHLRTLVEASSYQLLESLAEALAGSLLREFGIGWLRLRIAKPGALPGAREVGVEIERGAPESP